MGHATRDAQLCATRVASPLQPGTSPPSIHDLLLPSSAAAAPRLHQRGRVAQKMEYAISLSTVEIISTIKYGRTSRMRRTRTASYLGYLMARFITGETRSEMALRQADTPQYHAVATSPMEAT